MYLKINKEMVRILGLIESYFISFLYYFETEKKEKDYLKLKESLKENGFKKNDIEKNFFKLESKNLITIKNDKIKLNESNIKKILEEKKKLKIKNVNNKEIIANKLIEFLNFKVDNEFKELLVEHLKISKALTEKGIKMKANKINEYSFGNLNYAKQVLENSVANGYQVLFKIKNLKPCENKRNEYLKNKFGYLTETKIESENDKQ